MTLEEIYINLRRLKEKGEKVQDYHDINEWVEYFMGAAQFNGYSIEEADNFLTKEMRM